MYKVGRKLRELREAQGLRMVDVRTAGRELAKRRGYRGYRIALSRLVDYESDKSIPTIYRMELFSILYKVPLYELMKMFGVPGTFTAGERQAIERLRREREERWLRAAERRRQQARRRRRGRKRSPRQRVRMSRILKLLDQGLRKAEVARRVGVSRQYIHQIVQQRKAAS
jgi:transcriptional regulator with XRE-family HTH domain